MVGDVARVPRRSLVHQDFFCRTHPRPHSRSCCLRVPLDADLVHCRLQSLPPCPLSPSFTFLFPCPVSSYLLPTCSCGSVVFHLRKSRPVHQGLPAARQQHSAAVRLRLRKGVWERHRWCSVTEGWMLGTGARPMLCCCSCSCPFPDSGTAAAPAAYSSRAVWISPSPSTTAVGPSPQRSPTVPTVSGGVAGARHPHPACHLRTPDEHAAALTQDPTSRTHPYSRAHLLPLPAPSPSCLPRRSQLLLRVFPA